MHVQHTPIISHYRCSWWCTAKSPSPPSPTGQQLTSHLSPTDPSPLAPSTQPPSLQSTLGSWSTTVQWLTLTPSPSTGRRSLWNLCIEMMSLNSCPVGHEGQGSILYYLKQGNWANSLSAGSKVNADSFTLFVVSIELTEEGLSHASEVVASVLQYIR